MAMEGMVRERVLAVQVLLLEHCFSFVDGGLLQRMCLVGLGDLDDQLHVGG